MQADAKQLGPLTTAAENGAIIPVTLSNVGRFSKSLMIRHILNVSLHCAVRYVKHLFTRSG